MKTQRSAKNLMYFFWLISFFCANTTAHAEFLLFTVGDKASYTISQKLNSEYNFFDDKITYAQSEAMIDLDIKILSANPKASDYLFDVEVILKKIFIFEIQQDGKSSTIISYDSDGLKNPENKLLEQYIDKLINYPLNFRVEKDFQIQETTGYLAETYKDFESPSPMGLFGITPWTFELLLTQLFHLSGENLLCTNSYPLSCYQLLNWEDEALDEQEISVNQTSAYTVTAINSKHIKASWTGNAKVARLEDKMDGEVSVIGNVTWDIANPLIQKRNLKVKIEQIQNGLFPAHVKMSGQQTWKPKIITCNESFQQDHHFP